MTRSGWKDQATSFYLVIKKYFVLGIYIRSSFWYTIYNI